MHRLRAGMLALLVVGGAGACSTQLSPGDIVTGQVFLTFAVGTINDSAGTLGGLQPTPVGAGTYLNAVSAFRNNLGASAFQQPGQGAIHRPGPGVLVGAGAPPACAGLFAYGQVPGCNGVLGMPPAYVPANTSGFGGYSTGFIFTGLPPTPGAYAISTTVVVNAQNQPYGSPIVNLPASPLVLPVESAPTYASGGATGGGTFTVSVPAGVTETVIVVIDTTAGAQAATVETHSTSAVVPPGTLVPGDSMVAFAIGADYPFVEAGPPAGIATTPTLAGAGGTADMTVSGTTAFVQ